MHIVIGEKNHKRKVYETFLLYISTNLGVIENESMRNNPLQLQTKFYEVSVVSIRCLYSYFS